jgi:enamine deaminase RidA (YjgF/YER057c/UK114 family)
MTLRPITPAAIAPPFAKYSHAVEVSAGTRLVFVSGQLGIDAACNVPESAGEQARLCFAAIKAILAGAGMTLADIVRLNAYVTDRAFLPEYMAVRDAHVAAVPPASTLMIVSGFARPEFKVEIEAVAGRSD